MDSSAFFGCRDKQVGGNKAVFVVVKSQKSLRGDKAVRSDRVYGLVVDLEGPVGNGAVDNGVKFVCKAETVFLCYLGGPYDSS